LLQSVIGTPTPNPSMHRTRYSGLRRLAVPSSLRASAAAQRERWVSQHDASVVTADALGHSA